MPSLIVSESIESTASTSASAEFSESSKRILFFVPEGNVITNGVYASQILALARYLVESENAKCLILHYSPNGTIPNCCGKNIEFIDDVEKRGYVSIFSQSSFYKKLSKRFWEKIRSFNPTHIYVRQYQTADAAKFLAEKFSSKVIYSIRGEDVSERESLKGIKNWLVARWISGRVRKSISLATHVNTVSFSFAMWLKKTYKCDSSVLPCCVDEKFFSEISSNERSLLRDELKFSEADKVIVFSGSLFGWQCIDETIELFKKLCGKVENLKALFLVKDAKLLIDKCRDKGFPETKWRMRSCKPDEVGKYLQVADFGIMLRKDLLLNRVASPVKVGEYLASGLNIIVSPCVGDLADDLKNADFSFFYSGEKDFEKCVKYISAKKKDEAPKLFARNHYTWAGNENRIKEMFQ